MEKDHGPKGKVHASFRKLMAVSEMPIFIYIIVFTLIITLVTDRFFSSSNMLLISKQVAINGLLTIAVALTIISGGLDLSVGSMLGALIVFVGTLGLGFQLPYGVVFLLTLLAGGICGAINGLAIVGMSVPPIIVTLGTMSIFKGVVLVITNGSWFTGFPSEYRVIGEGYIPFGILLLATVIMALVMSRLKFGRHIYAVGGNETSARMAGININKVKLSVYIISGVLVGLATMLYLGRAGVGEPTAGTGYETQAMAAAVVGGTSFAGGRGSIPGAFLGAILMALLLSALVSLRISAYYQGIVIGLVIILALVTEALRNKYLRKA